MCRSAESQRDTRGAHARTFPSLPSSRRLPRGVRVYVLPLRSVLPLFLSEHILLHTKQIKHNSMVSNKMNSVFWARKMRSIEILVPKPWWCRSVTKEPAGFPPLGEGKLLGSGDAQTGTQA